MPPVSGDWRRNMKDLKHLLYFENLLQEAQNELILQAQSEGKVCVAYVCENTPEPLLNLPGAFLRVCARRAPVPWKWQPTT